MRDTTWFTDGRFGMFIHWGLYTGSAGVWKGKKITHNYSEWLQASEHIPRAEYRALTEDFNPVDFNAEEWIREAANAGMKYFLITSKHHDGFCLWPTRCTSYNVMDATPFKRDILGELAAACRKYDVKLGFYYSHWQDWEGTGGDVCSVHMENEEYTHPTQDEFEEYWQKKCLPQVAELIENYDPSFLWFDSWGELTKEYITAERQDELIEHVRKHSDKCLVNSRIRYDEPSDKCDYISMMDNCYPEQGFDKPWETSGTLNHSWAYHKMDYAWKSTEQLLKYLIGNASLGGNYQLNVGPMANGKFEPAAIKRLREIGCWMDVNGESIQGTEGSSFGALPWGRVTKRVNEDGSRRLYLHLWNVTPGTAITLRGIKSEPTTATILETRQPVSFHMDADRLWVEVPPEASGLTLPVIALDVEG